MKTIHKQERIKVRVKNTNIYHYLKVDRGLGDIIKSLWRYGIFTNNSCIKNQGKYTWICFDQPESVLAMIEIAKKNNPFLFRFFELKSHFSLVVLEDDVSMSLRFDHEELPFFKHLILETFHE